jgi:ABC-type cobalt transport system substrate-binding protein
VTEFTLLKFQLDDASFSANAPFGGSDEDADVEVEEEDDSGSIVPFFVGLLFLVAIAAVARKKLGGSEEEDELTVGA